MKLAVVIMSIEHIAMYVNDLEATKESFFKAYRQIRGERKDSIRRTNSAF